MGMSREEFLAMIKAKKGAKKTGTEGKMMMGPKEMKKVMGKKKKGGECK